ncbi:MAG TPA: radical SAM family heme chaperone HemW [Planctomycetes bacterium]|nr:radical SAM family heme chaperone HemW [Planctomycetota bacterium]
MAPRSDSGNPDGDCPPVDAPALQAPRGTPLYVHIPFCLRKCTYCDFFSVAADASTDTEATVAAILAEARRRAPAAPRTVFVGGGTPTFLSEAELEHLFETLESHTGFRSSAREVTVECNPESLTAAKARLLRELGVGRLSIGLQSLDPRILSLFDRPHTPEQGLAAYRIAREAGFEDVSVDLIYAVPGQSLDAWLAELDSVLDLSPSHLSAYSLAFEEGTALTHELETGRLEPLDEDLALDFFLETRAHLAARGLSPYEVSNFATPDHQCAHNVNYWRNGEYVGLGPGAVSKLGATRFGNPRSVSRWRRSVETDSFPASWEETPTALQRLGETWWLGLRTSEGVEPSRALERSGCALDPDPALREARELESQGLLVRRGGSFSLSPRGLPLADAVSRRFLQLAPSSVDA